MSTLILYCDGGSRGNPGDAGIGVVAFNCDKGNLTCILEYSDYLSNKSNNYAEYSAVISALEFALASDYKDIILRSDSKLIVEQLKGRWNVKHPELKKLYMKAFVLIGQISARGAAFEIEHVGRERNYHADTLANLAMDRKAPPAPHTWKNNFKELVSAWEAAMLKHSWAVEHNEHVDPNMSVDRTWEEVLNAWKALGL